MNGLINAFTDLLKRVDVKEVKKNTEKEIPKEVFTVKQKLDYIVDVLKTEQKIVFTDLFILDRVTRNELITTFQALLELIKHQIVKVKQEGTFSQITLEYNTEGGEEVVEIDEYN